MIMKTVQRYPTKKFQFGNDQAPKRWIFKFNQEAKDLKEEATDGLGRPVGVSFGNFGIRDIQKDEALLAQTGFLCCIAAFGENFLTPEQEWTELVLHHILEEGKKLTETNIEDYEQHKKNETVLMNFSLSDNLMEVQVGSPDLFGKLGKGKGNKIVNLEQALSVVLLNKESGSYLLRIRDTHILIWKKQNCYYVFDPFGRDSDCRSSYKGFAVILCLKSIRNICYLIKHLSNSIPNDLFTLHRIEMISIIPCCRAIQPPKRKRKNGFLVISDNHAIVQGHMHIENSHKKAISVAYYFLLQSKIDPPSTYSRDEVDSILAYSMLIHSVWEKERSGPIIGPEHLPHDVHIGQFLLRSIIEPYDDSYMGESELKNTIQKAIGKHKNLLVIVDKRIYAICKRSDVYYLLNPYPQESSVRKLYNIKNHATLHMFNDVALLCCEFISNVLKMPYPKPYQVYTILVTAIAKNGDIPALELVKEVKEVASLNESISYNQRDEVLGLKKQLSEDSFSDLDSPSISCTQVPKSYKEFKKALHGESDHSPYKAHESVSATSSSLSSESAISSIASTESHPLVGKLEAKKKMEQTPKDKEDDKARREKEKKIKKTRGSRGKERVGRSRDNRMRTEESEHESRKQPSKSKTDIADEHETEKTRTVEGDKARGGKEMKTAEPEVGSRDDQGKVVKIDDDERSSKSENAKAEIVLNDKEEEEEKSERTIGPNEAKDKPTKEPVGKSERFEAISNDTSTRLTDKSDGVDGNMVSDNDEEVIIFLDKEEDINKAKEEEHMFAEGRTIGPNEAKDKPTKEKEPVGKNERFEAGSNDTSTRLTDYSDGVDGSVVGDTDEEVIIFLDKEEDINKAKEGFDKTDEEKRSYEEGTSKPTKTIVKTTEQNGGFPQGLIPDNYPRCTKEFHDMVLAESKTGSYESLCNLISIGFMYVDRILVVTPWANYVAFKNQDAYFLYESCTCDVKCFQYWDLSEGTAGLLYCRDLHSLIKQIRAKTCPPGVKQLNVDVICEQYCS